MTHEEARELARLMLDTWPTHVIKAYVWTEAIRDLDHDTAHRVYEHLRDNDERPPGIARFLALYRSTTPNYGWQPTDDTGNVVTPQAGRHIARRAYIEDCIRQGRKPNLEWFDHAIGLVATHPQQPDTTPF